MNQIPSIDTTLITAALDRLRHNGSSQVLTIDIIREYKGDYIPDAGTPVSQSWNARFGR